MQAGPLRDTTPPWRAAGAGGRPGSQVRGAALRSWQWPGLQALLPQAPALVSGGRDHRKRPSPCLPLWTARAGQHHQQRDLVSLSFWEGTASLVPWRTLGSLGAERPCTGAARAQARDPRGLCWSCTGRSHAQRTICLSYTHTDTLTRSHTHSHTRDTHTHKLTLTDSHTHPHTLTHTHTLSITLTHTHKHTHALTPTHSHTLSITHKLTLTLAHTQSHTLTLTHSHTH